jgi:hypothetical protein
VHEDGGVENPPDGRVPCTCWYTNVPSNLSKAVWDRQRRRVSTPAEN